MSRPRRPTGVVRVAAVIRRYVVVVAVAALVVVLLNLLPARAGSRSGPSGIGPATHGLVPTGPPAPGPGGR